MPCSSSSLFPVRDEVTDHVNGQLSTSLERQNFCCVFYSNHKVLCPQETQERENKSRWELIKETLNKKFANYFELKASCALASFFFFENAMKLVVVPNLNHSSFTAFLSKLKWLLIFNYYYFPPECNFNIQRLHCQEVGLYCTTVVLHSGWWWILNYVFVKTNESVGVKVLSMLTCVCRVHAPLTRSLSYYHHSSSVYWSLIYVFLDVPAVLTLTIFKGHVCVIYIYVICCCRLSPFSLRARGKWSWVVSWRPERRRFTACLFQPRSESIHHLLSWCCSASSCARSRGGSATVRLVNQLCGVLLREVRSQLLEWPDNRVYSPFSSSQCTLCYFSWDLKTQQTKKVHAALFALTAACQMCSCHFCPGTVMGFTQGNVAALQRTCGSRKEQFTVFAQRSRLATCQRRLTLHVGECFIPAAQSIVLPCVCHKSRWNWTRVWCHRHRWTENQGVSRFVCFFFASLDLNYLQWKWWNLFFFFVFNNYI